MKNTTILLSGGLDSVTMAYKLVKAGTADRAIYLNFSKASSSQEIRSAKRAALSLGIPLEVVDLKGLGEIQKDYSRSKFSNTLDLDIGMAAQSTGISGFHSVLAASGYFAQLTGSSSVAVAITKEQFSASRNLAEVFSLYSKSVSILNSSAGEFTIITPFKSYTKSDIVAEARKLNVPIENTWSCLTSEDAHCGECSQCIARKDAFSGGEDPTTYQA